MGSRPEPANETYRIVRGSDGATYVIEAEDIRSAATSGLAPAIDFLVGIWIVVRHRRRGYWRISIRHAGTNELVLGSRAGDKQQALAEMDRLQSAIQDSGQAR